jgi:hypothetical protein
MSIRVKTKNATALLAAIDEAIADGTVTAWTVDDDGDYSLTDDDYVGAGWMRPTISSDTEVVLNILGVKDEDMTTGAFAALHSQFIDLLLMDFDSNFDEATITSQKDTDDDF